MKIKIEKEIIGKRIIEESRNMLEKGILGKLMKLNEEIVVEVKKRIEKRKDEIENIRIGKRNILKIGKMEKMRRWNKSNKREMREKNIKKRKDLEMMVNEDIEKEVIKIGGNKGKCKRKEKMIVERGGGRMKIEEIGKKMEKGLIGGCIEERKSKGDDMRIRERERRDEKNDKGLKKVIEKDNRKFCIEERRKEMLRKKKKKREWRNGGSWKIVEVEMLEIDGEKRIKGIKGEDIDGNEG